MKPIPIGLIVTVSAVALGCESMWPFGQPPVATTTPDEVTVRLLPSSQTVFVPAPQTAPSPSAPDGAAGPIAPPESATSPTAPTRPRGPLPPTPLARVIRTNDDGDTALLDAGSNGGLRVGMDLYVCRVHTGGGRADYVGRITILEARADRSVGRMRLQVAPFEPGDIVVAMPKRPATRPRPRPATPTKPARDDDQLL